MAGYGNFGGGLRDAGNGANDTAGAYGFILNAFPDREKTREAQGADSKDTMYPPVSMHDEKYQISYKGLHAFKDMRWNHMSESEFRNDIDMVNYMDNVAGLFSKNEKPWQVIESLAYVGTVKNDILNIEGSSKENTLGWSEKSTVRHTGNKRMMAGQLYYWDLPPLGAEMYSGGAAKMGDLANKHLPLWTMPYDPAIHRGSPELIYRALTEPLFQSQDRTEYGLHRHARSWLKATINAALVISAIVTRRMTADNPTQLEPFIQRFLDEIKKDDFEVEVNKTLLDPLGRIGGVAKAPRLFFPNHLPKAKPNLNKYPITGTTFKPTSQHYEEFLSQPNLGFNAVAGIPTVVSFNDSRKQDELWQTEFNRRHIYAAENLFYTTAKVNGFYSNRVIGMVLTSVDEGKDFDRIPVRIGNCS